MVLFSLYSALYDIWFDELRKVLESYGYEKSGHWKTEKVDIDEGKVDIQSEKVDIESVLS